MKTMYARLRRAGEIELTERELTLGEHDAIIQVLACGVCKGDVRAFQTAARAVDAFGHEPVGRVVAVGERVRRVAVGDLAAGAVYGGFAAYLTAHESLLHRVPEDLGEFAALAEPLKCVTTAVRAAAPEFMDDAAVVGCGFMGLAAIAALGRRGLRSLIAIDPAAWRRDLAKEFGATLAVSPQEAERAVRETTNGRGADAVVEFAGAPDAAALACRVARPRGRVALAGGASPAGNVYASSVSLCFAPPAFSPDESDDFRRAIAAMERGVFPLARLVSHRFPLSQIQRAFETAAGDPSYLKGLVVNDLSATTSNA